MMMTEQPGYTSYLLRLWQAEDEGRIVWRASLESTADNRRLNFPDLKALTDFLKSSFRSDPENYGGKKRMGSFVHPGNQEVER
jgi:hypothetical protein